MEDNSIPECFKKMAIVVPNREIKLDRDKKVQRVLEEAHEAVEHMNLLIMALLVQSEGKLKITGEALEEAKNNEYLVARKENLETGTLQYKILEKRQNNNWG